jgi:predicted RecA/RadA family phage recombinase
MNNLVSEGEVIQLTAPTGGVVSGRGYLIGQLFCIAVATVAQGLPFAARVGGVVDHAKLSAQAWTEGQRVYWDNTNFWFTTVNTGNVPVGTAVAVAANPSATGRVLLNRATAATAS